MKTILILENDDERIAAFRKIAIRPVRLSGELWLQAPSVRLFRLSG